MRNEDVVKAWLYGRRAATGNMSTDGSNLYSYNLLIGQHLHHGTVVINHTAGGGSFYSQTTSKHVGLAWRLANGAKLINP